MELLDFIPARVQGEEGNELKIKVLYDWKTITCGNFSHFCHSEGGCRAPKTAHKVSTKMAMPTEGGGTDAQPALATIGQVIIYGA